MELLGYLLFYIVILLYAYGIIICMYYAFKSKRRLLITLTLFMSAFSIVSLIMLKLLDSKVFDIITFTLVLFFLLTTVITFSIGRVAQEHVNNNIKNL